MAVTVWRLTHTRHIHSAFSRVGAETHGGRFSSAGRRMAYYSASISLALLELLPQTNRRSLLTNHWCISATMDDEYIEVVDAEGLSDDWDARPYQGLSQAVGDQWLSEERSLVLGVPSAVNPYERNFLINPLHPRFNEIEIGDTFLAPLAARLVE